MSTYTIGEVAERSGFSASALRYYEGIGLLGPAARTPAGYRLYDDHGLARLGFVARAKQLGCTLEEITDLVASWDGERCGPVQRHFHELVTDKIRDAHRQIAELTAFTAQLRTAAAQLAGEPVDGPCGEGCACLSEFARTAPIPVVFGQRGDDPAIACTLDQGAIPRRVGEWDAVLDHVNSRVKSRDGSIRLVFDADLDVGDLARLVAAEQQCCAFFSFAITLDASGIALEVSAPDGAADIVASLFGEPAHDEAGPAVATSHD